MSNALKTNIGKGDGEVIVTYDYDSGDAGDYYQPPEPESAYITSVFYKGIDIIDCLSSKQIEQLEEDCIKDMNECYVSMLEDKAEAQYEEMRLRTYGY